jgi:uncharacterized protein YbjQ (UPF0145 family)
VIELWITLGLLVAGYVAGRWVEAAHYRSIREREDRYRHVFLTSTRRPPEARDGVRTRLVAGNVVVSVDYFKSFSAGLRQLIGGRVGAYETLVDRARREALLRMQAEADALGAAMVTNVRFEHCHLHMGLGGTTQAIEALAYGTALLPLDASQRH